MNVTALEGSTRRTGARVARVLPILGLLLALPFIFRRTCPAAERPAGPDCGRSRADTTGGRPWNRISTWAYQLQHPSPERISASPFDLVVIDHSRDGTGDEVFSRTEIERMKHFPDGRRRLVVAYMSIGEAEPYRFYWRKGWKPGRPSWLLAPNPRWPDNYRVEYWNESWKAIVFGTPESYLDRIMDAGFDGVYLDIVDGYEYFGDRPTARREMIDFVIALARYARTVRGDTDFGVFPQNAPELLEDPLYLDTITGIGKEEVYFSDTDEATDEEDRRWDEELLDKVVAAGKLVLCVDYCKEPGHVEYVYRRARSHGYIPYCTNVELDRLTIRR